MAVDTKAIKQRHELLKQEKQRWLPLYELLSQYCFLRKQYFTSDANTEGPFLFNKTFDSTAIHAAQMMAASILGQIWPNPFESFEFVPQVAQDEAVFSDAYDMMNTVNTVMPVNLANEQAGVFSALHEIIMDLAVYGTAAAAVIETGNLACPVVLRALDAKQLTFAENEHGGVDSVYIERNYTVGQLVQKFGYDSVSRKVQKAYDEAKLQDKVKVLQAIEPRRERNPLLLGSQDMPFASVHFEVDGDHVLLESGFNEMPILVVRFWKNTGETLGRSPAMGALSDIRALNKLVEMYEKAGEFMLDPVKMISTEDILGASKIQWFPGANIPVHRSGRLGSDRPPIEPVQTSQNPGWATQRISDLRDSIKQYFMLDVLSDLSNTSRQTLGEANIRNELRMFMTGPMLIRVLTELIGPFLDRAFNIMLEMGLFGVIRGSVQDFEQQMMGLQPKYISEDFINRRVSGLKGYRINYISPAARLMKLEESTGLDTLLNFGAAAAQLDPGVTANFNFDEMLRTKQKLSGASQKVLFSPSQVEQSRRMQAQAQQQQQAMLEAQAQAAAFKDTSTGVKNLGAPAR